MASRIEAIPSLLTGVALMAAGSLLAWPATAQEAAYVAEFERPFGFDYGEEDRPFEAGTRDANGNRLIVTGRIQSGSSLSTGLNTAWGQTGGANGMIGTGTAVGNQLNVITNGSWNTVIVDATQQNAGDQTVILNGELDLND